MKILTGKIWIISLAMHQALDNVALLENYDKPRLNLTLEIFCCGHMMHIGWLHKND